MTTDSLPAPVALTLERIDVNGNYGPDNCRWVTQKEQARNTRRNKTVTWRGRSLCIAEWSELLGIPHTTTNSRVKAGWSAERTLTTGANAATLAALDDQEPTS